MKLQLFAILPALLLAPPAARCAAGPGAQPFYQGGDISMLTQFEKEGLVLKEQGRSVDLVQAMMRRGCNTFRVRLFVNPNGKGDTVQDLAYVTALGKRIKAAGGQFLLDFHYSDTWADPAQQETPAAWKELSFGELEKRVEAYTLEALTKCREAGCAPDLVQLGNEIQTGLLKPLGGYQKDGGGWRQYGLLLRAGVRGVRRSGVPAKIIIHAQNGGNAPAIESFCQRLRECQVEYDILGLSFYCEWQGVPAKLAKTLAAAAAFDKPVIVVEVAYEWKGDRAGYKEKSENFPYPFTPAGQRDFLAEILRIVRNAPKGLGQGVIWWHPESVKFGTRRVWKGGACALFDDRGEVLPALSAFAATAQAAAPAHKNVLLLCVDDLRPVMGCYGGAAKTPNLDRLAASAAVFTRHYIQWPVCGPSRASMLGGLRPDTTVIYENSESWKISKNPATQPALPQHFLDHGYRTLSIGKTYHSKGAGQGYGWSDTPWHPGNWTCYVNFKEDGGRSGEEGKGDKKSWRPAYEIFDGPDSLHNDCQTADKVIAALEQNKGRPFFIAGGFYKPHLPFVAPKKYWDLYTQEEVRKIEPSGLPKGAADFMYSWNEISAYGDPEGHLFSGDQGVGEEQTLKMVRAYYAAVSFIDAQIGRVLARLDELGLADTTAVVIWGDHGFHLGDHQRWAKHTQFEQAMRSPLIVRLPGRQKITGETQALVESVDIYPTLCEYAGLKTPGFAEGQSFLPVIEGQSTGKEAAFSQIRPVGGDKASRPMAYSVRTKEFRYVEWRNLEKGKEVVWRELYDHRTDPEESVSVADRPDYAEVVRQHAGLVLENYASLKKGK